jgi:hypothetical protein
MYRARVADAAASQTEPRWFFSATGSSWMPSAAMPTLDNWYELSSQFEQWVDDLWDTATLAGKRAVFEPMTAFAD